MQVLARYLQKLPGQTRAVGETCLYGLAAGAATVAFQIGMNWLYRLGLVRLSHQSMTTFLIGSFAVIVTSSLLVGWLLSSFCREAAGSGIPQLKLVFWKEFGTVPWRVAWVKFAAGILSIGGGSSLGREGPSVQLAGAAEAAGCCGRGCLGRPGSRLQHSPGGHDLCP
jgi:CIC family chloride channel protein